MMMRILTEPRNALVKQYRKLFAMEGVELTFEKEALEVIIRKAVERGTGARALRGIIEEMLTDLMFMLPDDSTVEEVIIDKAFAEGKREHITLRKGEKKAA